MPFRSGSSSITAWAFPRSSYALFIEKALHGYDKGTVFPAPINLAATWDREIAERTGSAICL